MDIKDIIKPENLVYDKSKVQIDTIMHYCPGCSHGVVHKILSELIEEMDIQEKTIGIAPVGCAVFAYNYIDIDWQEAAHGRAPAVATGVVRLNPDKFVFAYQGDGDLASIGAAEILHACNRGENLLVVFINNATYGMTGGQMAPTTLNGMVTSTTPGGRNIDLNGYPMKITELIAQLPGTSYVTRQAVHTAGAVRKCKRSLKKGIQNVLDKKGTSFVEVVSTCSSGWKMTPVDANNWMAENMIPYYPLGDMKDSVKGGPVSEN
ncbi:MAG: 2-oxoglutarate oxidoreductase [Prolixibacteraceae bacterium]|jgi:2-oxoglutarate/2-oxoacid ferredoxin oxidoreductase subunit beta|nr:2-oxoglutarate oxidoreductase [Prolixibacteraceae bacterium]MBT6765881.1 2-oxoglutarate oxidoreductase [Prolixibacteraceae bacterium]MBT7000927.1 2-oxoglutarate oxidoreductase [Prolixibacteraceae bacterium]MBT7394111.1 2-oxoglutarate oxidoreductase [Prolixibacteraceae bacterium]